MSNWIFLSKNGTDQYVNMLARGADASVTNTDEFDYDVSNDPIVLRGILKHKIIKRCWQDHRDFYYIDSGYWGNQPSVLNPQGWKVWHRIVKNDLQHGDIQPRPRDRWDRLDITLQPRRYGRQIIVAVPDEKPCRFYNIDRQQWIQATVDTIQKHTDRPVVIRQRNPNRVNRVIVDPLSVALTKDVHALVTFNSVAAVESIQAGVPAFVLAPTHAAAPVANQDLSMIESPYWPDPDKIHAWACHLAYGQFHVRELQDGTAKRILDAN